MQLRYALLVVPLLVFTGCARKPSPLVGTWTGATQTVKNDQSFMGLQTMVGQQASGSGTLILKQDGTGFLKVSIFPERPIAWSREADKLIIRDRDGERTSASLTQSNDQMRSETNTLVGTLAPDQKSLSIDYGYFTVVLHHGAAPTEGDGTAHGAQHASAE